MRGDDERSFQIDLKQTNVILDIMTIWQGSKGAYIY